MQWSVTTALSVLFLTFLDIARAQSAAQAPGIASVSVDLTMPPVQPLPADRITASDQSVPGNPTLSTIPTPPANQTAPTDQTPPADQATPPVQGPPKPLLDRAHEDLYGAMWHSAMRIDRLFGSDKDEREYHNVYGSIAPAILWDHYRGVQFPVRFNVSLPLPKLNERFNAFIGRVNPEEYVTERAEPSGAFQRQHGPVSEDQTLFGLAYHEPRKQGGYFDAGAGVRLRLPMDPYIKGSYVYEHGSSDRGLFDLRETLFWRASDGFGVTTRADVEHIYNLRWLVRWTGSATLSQKSRGVRGYSAVLGMRGFPSRRAVAMEIGLDGETSAPVPLHDYGVKVAYREAVMRRWFILEVRTSIDWPKDLPQQHRNRNLGLGVGFEMLFGTDEFLARPVTF